MDEPKDVSAPWKQCSCVGLSVSAWGVQETLIVVLCIAGFRVWIVSMCRQVASSRQVALLSCSAMRCRFLKSC